MDNKDTPAPKPKNERKKKAAPKAAGSQGKGPRGSGAIAMRSELATELQSVVRQLIDPLYERLNTLEHKAPPTPLIYSQLNAAMQDIQPLAKTEKHPEGFEFRRIDIIVAEIQPILARHKLYYAADEVISQEQVDRKVVLENGQSYVNIFTRMTVRYRWRSAIDGSVDYAVGVGEGVSEQQFSTNAAMTMAEKAMLCDVFAIPVYGEDDPEKASPERSVGQVAPQQYFTQPTATTEPSGGEPQPTLFDPPEPTEPQPTKKPKAKKDGAPPVVTVGGGGEQPEATQAPAAPPMSPGTIKIVQNNLKGKTKTEADLFKHFGVKGWDELKASQMPDVLAWVNS